MWEKNGKRWKAKGGCWWKCQACDGILLRFWLRQSFNQDLKAHELSGVLLNNSQSGGADFLSITASEALLNPGWSSISRRQPSASILRDKKSYKNKLYHCKWNLRRTIQTSSTSDFHQPCRPDSALSGWKNFIESGMKPNEKVSSSQNLINK